MRSNRYRTMPALVLAAMMIFIAATNRTSAQQSPACCSYTVIIHELDGICGQLPIPVTIRWNCPPLVTTTTNYFGNGTFIEPIGNPPLTSCPPACTVLGISLDGVNFILPKHNGSFNVNNCCYHASTGFDPNGCLIIKISHC